VARHGTALDDASPYLNGNVGPTVEGIRRGYEDEGRTRPAPDFWQICAVNVSFRVEVTAEAERDADAILEWLFSRHAGETGLRWFAALEDAIQSLAEFPERCAPAPENQVFPFEVRHLLYGHKAHVYRILFTDPSTVHVLQIRHGRRRPAKQ
jgi:plasmid stabilization system protein ParE